MIRGQVYVSHPYGHYVIAAGRLYNGNIAGYVTDGIIYTLISTYMLYKVNFIIIINESPGRSVIKNFAA